MTSPTPSQPTQDGALGAPFTADAKLQPYWWETTPRPALPTLPAPAEVDVAVIGSGYTGLQAALQTARGGRQTAVFDAEDAGWGCSSRNGGQVSTSVKPTLDTLTRRHGPQKAQDILAEGRQSLAYLGEFVQREGIDCSFGVVGRFHAAHNEAQFRQLARKVERRAPGPGVDAYLVPRSEQRAEIGTDSYHGGVVYTRHASVDPARYHQGLLQRVQAAGAQVLIRCPVLGLERDGARFKLTTARGTTLARDVVVATNGYTGALTPWLRRRVIPIGSYIIATEEMPREQVAALIPHNRIVSDTRKVVFYYRASPDQRRIVFGGRVSFNETDPRVSGPILYRDLVGIFPALASVRISHSWCGFVAYTFDEMMHLGRHEGIHYAMGYCGSGVGMGSYLGMRLGQQVLGLAEGRTAFDGLAFPTRPLYTGKPWFLAPSIRYYRWRDRMPW
jgi:glycine/D-amino acid oxidase-like deaminating enzyme